MHHLPLRIVIFLLLLLAVPVQAQQAATGSITLHNLSPRDLNVIDERDEIVGVLRGQGDDLVLDSVRIGDRFRFRRADGSTAEGSLAVTVWRFDRTYDVDSREPLDPRESTVRMNPNLLGIDIGDISLPFNAAGSAPQPIFEGLDGKRSVDYTSALDNLYLKSGFSAAGVETGSGQEITNMYHGMESLRKSWAIAAGLSGTVPIKGVDVKGDLKIGKSKLTQTDRSTTNVYVNQRQEKLIYSVRVDPERAALSADFKRRVLALSGKYPGSPAFEEFRRDFGTHYYRSIDYGGYYDLTSVLDQDTYSKLQRTEIGVKAAVSASMSETTKGLGTFANDNTSTSELASTDIGFSSTTEELNQKERLNGRLHYTYAGGRGNFGDWTISRGSQSEAIPVKVELGLITDLIDIEVFRDGTDPETLQEIAETMDVYLEEYFSTLPRQEAVPPPPTTYELELLSFSVLEYGDRGDATKGARVALDLVGATQRELRNWEVNLPVRSQGQRLLEPYTFEFDPERSGENQLSLDNQKVRLTVSDGNPEKLLFRITGEYQEYDSNWGGSDDYWSRSNLINLQNLKPGESRNISITHNFYRIRASSPQKMTTKIGLRLTRLQDEFNMPSGTSLAGNSSVVVPNPAEAVGVILYEDADFQGRYYNLADVRDYDYPDLAGFEDKIGSIRVQPGLVATLYEHRNFGGKRREITGNVSNLDELRIGNALSSLRLEHASRQSLPVIHYHANMRGPKMTLREGFYNIGDLGDFNDQISSVTVPSGYQVTLYEDHDRRGDAVSLIESDGSLREVGFNDRVSSVEVKRTSRSGLIGRTVYIQNVDEHQQVLDVRRGASGNGTNLQPYGRNNTASQQFTVVDAGGGYVFLESKVKPNFVVDVQGGRSSSNTNVQMWMRATPSVPAQQFQLRALGNNTYLIVPRVNASLALDNNLSNNNVEIWNQNGKDNQRWKLYVVP